MGLGIDKPMNMGWLAYTEWAEKEYKAGFLAGYVYDESPDASASHVYKDGYGQGYAFAQMSGNSNAINWQNVRDL